MRFARFAVLPLVLLLVPACGDDDDDNGPTGPTLATFVGSWTATQFQFTAIGAPPAVTPIDLVTLFAEDAFNITITANGSFTGSITLINPLTGQQFVNPIAGTLTLQSSTEVAADFTPESQIADRVFTYSFSADGRTLTFVDMNATYPVDWNQDGQPDPARLDVILRKN